MTEPISTHNLDRYGSAELPWSRPRDILASDAPEADLTFFMATVRPDGRPHSAGVGATWVDSALYFTSGPGTLKSRNLAVNPARGRLAVTAHSVLTHGEDSSGGSSPEVHDVMAPASPLLVLA